MGPEEATYVRAGRSSQIDWILAGTALAGRFGAAQVLPGLSRHDHRVVAVEYTAANVRAAGPQRPLTPKLQKLEAEEWQTLGKAAASGYAGQHRSNTQTLAYTTQVRPRSHATARAHWMPRRARRRGDQAKAGGGIDKSCRGGALEAKRRQLQHGVPTSDARGQDATTGSRRGRAP